MRPPATGRSIVTSMTEPPASVGPTTAIQTLISTTGRPSRSRSSRSIVDVERLRTRPPASGGPETAPGHVRRLRVSAVERVRRPRHARGRHQLPVQRTRAAPSISSRAGPRAVRAASRSAATSSRRRPTASRNGVRQVQAPADPAEPIDHAIEMLRQRRTAARRARLGVVIPARVGAHRHAHRPPPFVEDIAHVGFAELDAQGPRRSPRPWRSAFRSMARYTTLKGMPCVGPLAHQLEPGADDAYEMPAVDARQVVLDRAAVLTDTDCHRHRDQATTPSSLRRRSAAPSRRAVSRSARRRRRCRARRPRRSPRWSRHVTAAPPRPALAEAPATRPAPRARPSWRSRSTDAAQPDQALDEHGPAIHGPAEFDSKWPSRGSRSPADRRRPRRLTPIPTTTASTRRAGTGRLAQTRRRACATAGR